MEDRGKNSLIIIAIGVAQPKVASWTFLYGWLAEWKCMKLILVQQRDKSTCQYYRVSDKTRLVSFGMCYPTTHIISLDNILSLFVEWGIRFVSFPEALSEVSFVLIWSCFAIQHLLRGVVSSLYHIYCGLSELVINVVTVVDSRFFVHYLFRKFRMSERWRPNPLPKFI